MTPAAGPFSDIDDTFARNQEEIQGLSDGAADSAQRLSEGHDSGLVAEPGDRRTARPPPWDEYRAERARVRFGERELIIARARHEERLERAQPLWQLRRPYNWTARGVSSAGRAPALQAGGRRFDPECFHEKRPWKQGLSLS